MALLRKINARAKTDINTGFSTNTDAYGGRLINKNGRPNVEKRGLGPLERISWYHTMLEISNTKFLLLVIIFYITVNLIFALIYYSIGVEHLAGILANSSAEKFIEAYFFSAQTLTTVGYGRISPVGFLTSTVAAIEALVGLLSLALATSLFYGRFSKPKAYLRFSEKAVLAPFKESVAIMMRVAPFKNNNLIDAEAKLTAGLTLEENGKTVNRFYPLEMEYSKVNALTLSWTLVHPVTEDSPFYRFTREDFANTRGEIIVFLKAFDDMFSNTVVARTSYTLGEIIIGAKFIPMFHLDNDNNKTVLDLEKIGLFTDAEIKLPAEKDNAVTAG
ncbi:MAG: ion channel [Ferruginibacter sp.]